MKIITQSAILEFITPDALQLIERAGRTCYKSEDRITDDSAKAFIKLLRSKEHASVFEHAIASFRFITDRGVTHEMVRHRLASYSQESTRYCNYSKDKFENEITLILPVRFKKVSIDPVAGLLCSELTEDEYLRFENWLEGLQGCERSYLRALGLGESPQEARDLLPNSLKTEIFMTANFREWMHFFSLRTSEKAHPQMRDLALQAQQILHEEYPEIF